MMPQTLEVLLGDHLVGYFTNLTVDRNVFTFDSAYVDDPNRPTLSLSYDAERTLSMPTTTPQARLPPFFANLLPESHLRQYLARRAHVNPARDFPLLWLLGEDLPGAVIIRHREGLNAPSKSAESVISKGVEDDPNILKFSLAGVQLKFGAVREADGDLTIPMHGRNGDWILRQGSSVTDGRATTT